jgi:hypothetical protein
MYGGGERQQLMKQKQGFMSISAARWWNARRQGQTNLVQNVLVERFREMALQPATTQDARAAVPAIDFISPST